MGDAESTSLSARKTTSPVLQWPHRATGAEGRQFDRVPIPVDVGEAIATWLCNGRKGSSRHVFVCLRPLYARLTSSGPVRRALRKAYRRAGLVAPGDQARTHAWRHGLTMALLDGGSSLGEIGDVLHHRCARLTTAYARYHHRALRALARPWPVPGEER